MKLKVLLCSLILIAAPTHAKELIVEVPSEGIALEYTAPVRLERVLADAIRHAAQSSPVQYPIANQLFDRNKENQAQALKMQVLKDLQAFANHHSELSTSIQLVIEQIKRWDIGFRELTSLDYDYVRLKPDANPMLKGKFELIIPERNETVSIEGLLFSPQSVSFNSAYHLSDYIDNIIPLSSSHNSDAWVIYPDGQVVRSGFAYWNNERLRLTPGSVIFLGFGSEDTQLVDIEKNIVKLISMRKGL